MEIWKQEVHIEWKFYALTMEEAVLLILSTWLLVTVRRRFIRKVRMKTGENRCFSVIHVETSPVPSAVYLVNFSDANTIYMVCVSCKVFC